MARQDATLMYRRNESHSLSPQAPGSQGIDCVSSFPQTMETCAAELNDILTVAGRTDNRSAPASHTGITIGTYARISCKPLGAISR
jgi:hypothetical protein